VYDIQVPLIKSFYPSQITGHNVTKTFDFICKPQRKKKHFAKTRILNNHILSRTACN